MLESQYSDSERFRYVYDTSIGRLTIISNEDNLFAVMFGDKNSHIKEKKTKISDKTCLEIKEYLEGKRKKFTVPYILEGTDFQKKVWKALADIPYGETRSYKDIAHYIKNNKACRAVGLANSKNPIVIIVPCHRIIRSDDSIGGFGGGVELKKHLLKLEKNIH